ncbi:MAG TPA: hypothetical protein VGQ02_10835 [Candidatus Limnocylindrales bacterium]|jgi:hypothetical protein|nr:hypothetical protein [Candidatus Limnocylindrales bacterium]
MGFGALVAAIQGSVTAPPFSLWLNGLDVLRAPGALYGVPIDTIELVEKGPGGVSSLKFVIRDQLKDITIHEGDGILYQDNGNGRPLFKGWVQTWSPRPEALGRTIAVKCVGQEIVLDWLVVPSLTIPAGTPVDQAVQTAAAAAAGIGFPLRTFGGASLNGTQAAPVGVLKAGFPPNTRYAITVSNEPLRAVIGKIIAAGPDTTVTGFGFTIGGYGTVTVDFYDGLRFYLATAAPSDYDTLTVADTVAGVLVAADLAHTFDAGSRVRQVSIVGGNAAGTGVVSDGSGIPGPTAAITDAAILTSDDRDAIGGAYLADKSLTGRGSLTLEANTIATNIRAGSPLDLTDAETGATGVYPIGSITKRFYGGTRQDWTITYGGLPASFAAAVRRLTRTVLS